VKRVVAFAPILAVLTWAAVAQAPRISRATLRTLEEGFDKRVLTLSAESPFQLLGTTRGVYLDGYGAVFTTEVNLMATTNLSPFQLTIPKEYVIKVHAQKLLRVQLLKRSMQEALLATANALDSVPPSEQVALGVSLFYYKWEDTSQLPSQVLMRAQRQKLLDVHLGRVNRSALDSVIQVEEL
jgi:hypothetical protein